MPFEVDFIRIYGPNETIAVSTVFWVCGSATSTYSFDRLLKREPAQYPLDAIFRIQVVDLSVMEKSSEGEFILGEVLVDKECQIGIDEDCETDVLEKQLYPLSSGRRGHRVQVTLSLHGICPLGANCTTVAGQMAEAQLRNHRLSSYNESVPLEVSAR